MSRHTSAKLIAALAWAVFTTAVLQVRADPPGPAPHPAAASFARHVADRLAALVWDAAALDPATGQEDRAGRKARRQRIHELRVWYNEHNRPNSIHACRTQQERDTYVEMRRLLASGDLIDQPAYRRRRICKTVHGYADMLAAHLPAAVLDTLPQQDVDNPSVAQAPLAGPPDVQPYYFGPGARTVALYLPETRTLYLNLNTLVNNADRFIDVFEHELWHHLLPGITADNPGVAPWFEGFNEVFSETCAYHMNLRANHEPDHTQHAVAYPLQALIASLVVTADRAAAAAYLTGNASHADVAERLRRHAATQGPTAQALAHVFEEALLLPAWKREKVETILRHWGWKNTNGSGFSLPQLIDDGDAIDPQALSRLYRQQRPLFTDLVDALSVLLLQELVDDNALTRDTVTAMNLPPALHRNARRVLTYLRTPSQPLRAL